MLLKRTIQSVFILVSGTVSAANIFWGGGGDDNRWDNEANWGASGVLPGENQSDQAVISIETTEGTAATIDSVLSFTNPVRLALRHQNYMLVETGGSASFTTIQVGVHGSAGKGASLTQTGGILSGTSLEVGSETSADYGNVYSLSGSSVLTTSDNMTIGAGSTFSVSGDAADINIGDGPEDELIITGVGSTLMLVPGSAGGSVIEVSGTLTLDANANLFIDASNLPLVEGTYELVRYSSVAGAFSTGNIAITGLDEGFYAAVGYDADSMKLVVRGEAADPSESTDPMMYLPITCTFKASAGANAQSNDDLICNGVDLGTSGLSCTRTSSEGGYIYSVSYVADMDRDGFEDYLSFDLRVEGFDGSTYSYSATSGASSVTKLGETSDVTDIDNSWGVGGDYEIGAGQSLRFSVENFSSTLAAISYEGINSLLLRETDGGNSHMHIRGFGEGLDSGIFSASSEAFEVQESDADPLVVTGAGSAIAGKNFAIDSISLSFKGPLITWDPTDYSHTRVAPYMLDEYPAQTNYENYPDFSWDTVPRWLIIRKSSPAYTDDELTAIAGNYEVVVWEKANNAGFSTIEEGIIDASSRLKVMDPTVKSLFYRNTSLHYGGYASDSTYDRWNWSRHTTDANGTEVLDLHKDIYPWYNYDVADMRDWWLNESALPTILHDPINGVDPIDGVFCDKCLVPTEGYFFDEIGTPYDNYIGTQFELAEALETHNKLMVGNVIRNERHNGGREYMRFFDGSYLERWTMPYSDGGQSTADAVCASLQLMREASLKGKIIMYKTGENAGTSSQEEMEDEVAYHLALYLIVAESYSYFAFQDHVSVAFDDYKWETSWIPEFSRPLGVPLGGPLKDSYIYTRSFKHVEVWVDVAKEEFILAWDSLDSDDDGLNDMWEFRHFRDITGADPSGNPDGDAYTNEEEYLAGLDPHVPDSFNLTNLTVEANHTVLRWNAVSGCVYSIYWSRNLVDGFSLIKSNVTGGVFIDMENAEEPAGFYKLKVELEP